MGLTLRQVLLRFADSEKKRILRAAATEMVQRQRDAMGADAPADAQRTVG